MAIDDHWYDGGSKTLWFLRHYDDPDTLVPNDEIRAHIETLKAGQDEAGRDIAAINYVFVDRATAEYNHQPLSFTQLGTFVGDRHSHEPFDEDAPSFGTREDFGI